MYYLLWFGRIDESFKILFPLHGNGNGSCNAEKRCLFKDKERLDIEIYRYCDAILHFNADFIHGIRSMTQCGTQCRT